MYLAKKIKSKPGIDKISGRTKRRNLLKNRENGGGIWRWGAKWLQEAASLQNVRWWPRASCLQSNVPSNDGKIYNPDQPAERMHGQGNYVLRIISLPEKGAGENQKSKCENRIMMETVNDGR